MTYAMSCDILIKTLSCPQWSHQKGMCFMDRVLSYLFLKIQVLRICQKRMSSFKLLIIVWFGSLGECIYLFNFLSYLLHEKYPYSEFSGSCFPAFGLNTERFEMSLHIESKCKKIQTRTLPIQTFFTQWLRMITIQKGLI